MVNTQDVKYVVGLAPVSAGGAFSTVASVDRAGYFHAACVVMVGAIAADTTASTKIVEGSTTSPTTAITGASFGAAQDGVLTTASDAGSVHVIYMDLMPRQRYLKFNCTAGGTTLLSMVFILSRTPLTPDSLTLRNVNSCWFV